MSHLFEAETAGFYYFAKGVLNAKVKDAAKLKVLEEEIKRIEKLK